MFRVVWSELGVVLLVAVKAHSAVVALGELTVLLSGSNLDVVEHQRCNAQEEEYDGQHNESNCASVSAFLVDWHEWESLLENSLINAEGFMVAVKRNELIVLGQDVQVWESKGVLWGQTDEDSS